MSKIAIFLADGFEEIEGLTVVDICRRCGLTIDMVSITEDRQVMGSHKIPVTADMTLSQVDFDEYDCLVLPGGGQGTKNLEACEVLMQHVGNLCGTQYFRAQRYLTGEESLLLSLLRRPSGRCGSDCGTGRSRRQCDHFQRHGNFHSFWTGNRRRVLRTE